MTSNFFWPRRIFSDLDPKKIGVLEPPEAIEAEFCLNWANLCLCLSFKRALKGSGLLSLMPERLTGVFSGSCSVFSFIPMVWGAVGGSISDELRRGEALEDALVGLISVAEEAATAEPEAAMLEAGCPLLSKLALLRFLTRLDVAESKEGEEVCN